MTEAVTETAGFVMTDAIGAVTSVFTAAIGWVGTIADTIAGEPILLMFVVVPLVGLGVGLFKRLINVN